MAYASTLGHILIVFVTIVVFYPKSTQSGGFIEQPHSVTEYAGVYIEFRCRHTGLDSINWHLNGTSIRDHSVFPEECRNFTAREIFRSLQDIVYVFLIKAAVQCNRTQVQCLALIGYNETMVEPSDIAILTVLRPDAVKNLNNAGSIDNGTFSIAMYWSPIPDPESFLRGPLVPEAFVRNITYQVNITDNFGRLVNSSKTNSTSIVITLTDVDISPCNYYNASVIAIINFELKYRGIEARIGQIYPYKDFPSSISASLHNSTVIEMYDSEIQYVFVLSVSLYVCSVNLQLLYQEISYPIEPVIMSNEIPGRISELTFVINHSLFDKKYDDVTIYIANALQTKAVNTSPLNTYDIQDVTIHNGSITIVFLNGSTAKGAFIVLTITDNRTLKSTFEYLPIEKSPSSNTAEWILPYNANYASSSLILSVYDIESTGVLKDNLSLMPVKTLPWPLTSLIVTDSSDHADDAEMDDYESGWELHVSSTSNSIHFDCKIFELEVIHGCSAVVHTQNSSEGLILSVNNSINNDTLTPHSLEVKVQNEMELYFYAVFPLTSKGIIGSNPMKGSIRVNNGESNQVIILSTVIPLTIILMIWLSLNVVAILKITIHNYRIRNGEVHHAHEESDDDNNNERAQVEREGERSPDGNPESILDVHPDDGTEDRQDSEAGISESEVSQAAAGINQPSSKIQVSHSNDQFECNVIDIEESDLLESVL